MRTEIRDNVEWTILEGNNSFVARESSHVEARGSSHVVAWESSHVVAKGSSHVVARESSHVEAWGSSHVEAWGSSHVVAWESSHVVAKGSSHVVAWGSSHVEAWGSSHVEAWESSHVEAWGSSHVVAWGSSHVVAKESSHVEAWDFSAIHQLSSNCKIKKSPKSTIIKPNYPSNIKDWAKIKGVKIKRNRIYLYKVLRLNGTDWYSGEIDYLKKAIAPDWDNNFKEECGYALHLADSPEGAKYFNKDNQNYLLIEVSAAIEDCKPFPGLPEYPMKLRARACKFEKIIERVVDGKIEA